MAYASRDDIETLYSADALHVADHGGNAGETSAAISRALTQATDEIDSHLRVRYDTPVTPVPWLLTQVCVDIALYRLANTPDVLSDEMRQRYEDAIKQLGNLASGKMRLAEVSAPGEPEKLDGPRPIVRTGPERLFTRAKTEGL